LQKVGSRWRSAKGAKYDSQGQALSNAKRVALVSRYQLKRALKVRNIGSSYSALSEFHAHYAFSQGRRASRCSALAPGYHISAPLALRRLNCDFVQGPLGAQNRQLAIGNWQ